MSLHSPFPCPTLHLSPFPFPFPFPFPKSPISLRNQLPCVGFGLGIPGLQFGIGLGVGYRIGYGFGYGVERGVAHDEKWRYSNASKHFHGPVNLPTRLLRHSPCCFNLFIIFSGFLENGNSGTTSSFIWSKWPSIDISLDNEVFVVLKGHNTPQQGLWAVMVGFVGETNALQYIKHVSVRNTLVHVHGMFKNIETSRQLFADIPSLSGMEYYDWSIIVEVNYSLLDMYAKCGALEEAYETFDGMGKKNAVTWNTMILGLAVMALQMMHCHGGMVDEGRRFFDVVKKEYHIQPTIKPSGCMVDILGRAGLHGNVELGEQVRKHLLEFEPDHMTMCFLQNHTSVGKWNEVTRLRNSKQGGFRNLNLLESVLPST
ncbi:hypothetical protein NC652_029322 [Populus alba x Populus x berolinensis]|nr:hypothetical protein NC652_029322 [Populus alba x Populus x berolinensis]